MDSGYLDYLQAARDHEALLVWCPHDDVLESTRDVYAWFRRHREIEHCKGLISHLRVSVFPLHGFREFYP